MSTDAGRITSIVVNGDQIEINGIWESLQEGEVALNLYVLPPYEATDGSAGQPPQVSHCGAVPKKARHSRLLFNAITMSRIDCTRSSE